MSVVVGTAGHIDHGKTTLLRALTGIDADRLPEERRRGMTIDVGYAHLRLPDGDELDFVDVPGHERLVGNMLVGAGEIDAVLVVVAADDGPRAQTIEHLELVDCLGIEIGLAAVTKVDQAEPARVATVVRAVTDLLGRTALAGSPVLAVSSVTGRGLDELRDALVAVRDRVRASRGPAPGRTARLAVDRVFTIRGRGAVVTGTLRGGRLSRGDLLRLEPAGLRFRARELQVHGRTVDAADDGGRLAVNLAGEGVPSRGDVLTSDPDVGATVRLATVLRRPPHLDPRQPVPDWPPPGGSAVRVHLGTATVDGRIGRGTREILDLPDGRRVAWIRLDRPIAASSGEPIVLRRPSPAATLAGGVVLDASPPAGPSSRRVTPERLAAMATASGAGLAAARLDLHGVLPHPGGTAGGGTAIAGTTGGGTAIAGTASGGAAVGGFRLAPDVLVDMEDRAVADVAEEPADASSGHRLADVRATLAGRLRRVVSVDRRAAAAIASAALDRLVAAGRLDRDGDVLRPAGRPSPALPVATLASMDRLERLLAAAGPPGLADAARTAGCPPEGIRALESAGRIVRLGPDLAYAASTYRDLEATAMRMATSAPLSPAALRDATGTSRKYVMALLEELDRRGVLARTAAGHVPGPRAGR
jgi:selenocysteine-specific elongation factor